MIDLATYEPRGDKKNSSFFEDNLPRVYERRSQSGLTQLVGAMAAVVIQVDHGDGLAYMAELALMGPYRFRECWLNETHRIHLLEADPLWPKLILLEPLNRGFEDEATRCNRMYPLAAAKPNARYIGEIFSTSSCRDLRSVLEPQNIRFVYPDEASNNFYALPHLTFTFLSDYTYNRVGYVDVPLDSLAALDLGDRVLLDAESLELLEAAGQKHHRSVACWAWRQRPGRCGPRSGPTGRSSAARSSKSGHPSRPSAGLGSAGQPAWPRPTVRHGAAPHPSQMPAAASAEASGPELPAPQQSDAGTG